ncbi:MAG: UMP kinase [Promethearchaeota archaeon]
MVNNIVIKIGGSLLFKDKNINIEKIEKFCDIIKNSKNYSTIVIVCGGGIVARNYINAVREFKGSESLCDLFGIDVSRINSKLIIAGLGNNAYPQSPKSMEEFSIAQLAKKTIVMGGLQPGQSTTSVAVEVAEYIKADKMIILTDVDGIYDKDPRKNKDARMFKHLTYDELQDIIIESSGESQAAAGEYRIFDAVSLQLLKRSKMKTFIMSGQDLKLFRELIIEKKKVPGTSITL